MSETTTETNRRERMMFFKRNIVFGQWKGCVFVQVGASVLGIQISRTSHRSWGLELFTPARWFALRPFHSLTVRRSP